MSEIDNKNTLKVKVHQCLFGYQDGHKLLSQSIELPDEISSKLLLLSDLAPGLNIPVKGGYWTGIPLLQANSYALMFTWLAPEMSRPGCVWTHVLIIDFSDMARFPDLSLLMQHIKHPKEAGGSANYIEPIYIDPVSKTQNGERRAKAFGTNEIFRIISAVYSQQATGKTIAQFGELDDALFAVWSQQWPRLRRSFSFRTASSLNSEALTTKFNLSIILGRFRDDSNLIEKNISKTEEWEKTCIKDILYPNATDFRRFLWRYGSDIRLGRKQFIFLVKVYLETRSEHLEGEALITILKNIFEALSNPEDGKVLKEDIVGQNQYSLLPSVDSLDLVLLYINAQKTISLPPLPQNIFEAIGLSWISRLTETVSVAEIAVENESDFGNQFLKWFASSLDFSTFYSCTSRNSALRSKLLSLNPALLDNSDIVTIPGKELLSFVNYIPSKNHYLIGAILKHLFSVDRTDLSEEMVQRFPDVTVPAVICAIESRLIRKKEPVPQSWITATGKQTSRIVKSGFVEDAATTSVLSAFASMLEYTQPAIKKIGPIPWAVGINNAQDDLRGNKRKKFLVFILKLALHKPEQGCEPIFEIAFDSIHADLRKSNLSWQMATDLMNYLPHLNWFNNWDFCQRLKVGIVDSYVNNNLSLVSFKKLTTNAKTQRDLIELAEKLKGGKSFLEQV